MGEIFERFRPQSPLEWTGERLTTEVGGQVEIEHLHRYMMARDLCRGLDVLDIASGEGYGTAMLAAVAKSAVGVEISAEAAGHAARQYRLPNLRYLQGDARSIPLADASVDVVTSFETIEHFYEQDVFLSEVRRVLRPNGTFIVSSPDREIYSPPSSVANPYHKRELSRSEFEALLGRYFAQVRVLCQRPMLGSVILTDTGTDDPTLTIERRGETHYERSDGISRPPYLVAFASNADTVPVLNSVYVESGEVGPLMARAAEYEALKVALAEATHRAEHAESAFAASRAELAKCISEADEERQAASTRITALEPAAEAVSRRRTQVSTVAAAAEPLNQEPRHDYDVDARDFALNALAEERDTALADLKQACMQRDLARSALRRSRLQAEQAWASRLNALEARYMAADADAQHWRARYEGLRNRLEGLLIRSGLYRVSRLIPSSLRRSLVAKLLHRDAR